MRNAINIPGSFHLVPEELCAMITSHLEARQQDGPPKEHCTPKGAD